MGKLIYIKDNGQKPPPAQLVTSDDMEAFRVKLLMDIKMILDGHQKKTTKRWLKSSELRKILGISAGTLQSLRDKGKIPFTRMGRLIYYDAGVIDNLLASQKIS